MSIPTQQERGIPTPKQKVGSSGVPDKNVGDDLSTNLYKSNNATSIDGIFISLINNQSGNTFFRNEIKHLIWHSSIIYKYVIGLYSVEVKYNACKALIDIYKKLKKHEATSTHGKEGELLFQDRDVFSNEISFKPWDESKPKRTEDLLYFDNADVYEKFIIDFEDSKTLKIVEDPAIDGVSAVISNKRSRHKLDPVLKQIESRVVEFNDSGTNQRLIDKLLAVDKLLADTNYLKKNTSRPHSLPKLLESIGYTEPSLFTTGRMPRFMQFIDKLIKFESKSSKILETKLILYRSVFTVLLDREGNPWNMNKWPELGHQSPILFSKRGNYFKTAVGKPGDYLTGMIESKSGGEKVKVNVIFTNEGYELYQRTTIAFLNENNQKSEFQKSFETVIASRYGRPLGFIICTPKIAKNAFSNTYLLERISQLLVEMSPLIKEKLIKKIKDNHEEYVYEVVQQIIIAGIFKAVMTISKKVVPKLVPLLNFVSTAYDAIELLSVDENTLLESIACLKLAIYGWHQDDMTIASKILSVTFADLIYEQSKNLIASLLLGIKRPKGTSADADLPPVNNGKHLEKELESNDTINWESSNKDNVPGNNHFHGFDPQKAKGFSPKPSPENRNYPNDSIRGRPEEESVFGINPIKLEKSKQKSKTPDTIAIREERPTNGNRGIQRKDKSDNNINRGTKRTKITTHEILTKSNLIVYWTSKRGHTVYITTSGQLIGSYRALALFVKSHRNYKNWDKHHIIEDIHLANLGIRSSFESDWEDLPCVLLPKAAHSERIRDILSRADSDKSLTAEQLLKDYYLQAYELIGDYTGSGNERLIQKELIAIAKSMLGFI